METITGKNLKIGDVLIEQGYLTEKDLEKLLKITGIWLSFPVTETATFVLALLIFRAGRKKETLEAITNE